MEAVPNITLHLLSYLAPRLRHPRVLRLAVPDEVLLLEKGEGAILAPPPLLLLMVDLHVRQQVPLPLELLAAVQAGERVLPARVVVHGHVLLQLPLLQEQLAAHGARGVDRLDVEGQVAVQEPLAGEALVAVLGRDRIEKKLT